MEFVSAYYPFIKAFHLIAVISWMAGLLYLPRLYVYHADVAATSDTAQTFQVMERKLLRFIMNPAMVVTFLLGGLMLSIPGMMEQGWMHIKLLLVLLMAGFHGACAAWMKGLAAGTNTHSARFYRIANEVPTVLLVIVVVLAVVKPF